MIIDLVKNYTTDCIETYRICAAALGISTTTLDLLALLRMARKGLVNRQGEVSAGNNRHLKYHIHGAGYSFTDVSTGRETSFDVCIIGGKESLRFTAWHVYAYASSIGKYVTEEGLRDQMRELSLIHDSLTHVTDSGFDYYRYSVVGED